MYSLDDYGSMISDADRFGAYGAAIAAAVQLGDVVVDVGCGPGMFSLLACQAGARQVYAIEAAEVIQVGRQLATANGFAERIRFIEGDSRRIELPEKARVVISDIRGALPLFQHSIESILDAQNRFLATGGVLIPQRDTLYAAIIEAKSFYETITTPWQCVIPGLSLTAPLHICLNDVHHTRFDPNQLLTEPRVWCVLDYAGSSCPRPSARVHFVSRRDGTAHGVAVWFATQLFRDIGFSTAPDRPRGVYGHIFLPFLEPLGMRTGDEIQVDLHADLVGSDYVWRWDTRISGNGSGPQRHLRQSTFEAAQLSLQVLRRRAADFIPKLSEEGEAERWLLHAMDGKAALQQIAESAAKRFPKIFPRWQDALTRAGELSARFSR